ncbi:hypothetical protein [Erwinia billingiae]|uniref:hypothetical protein n=1 Tax=Erwinia billingiae TaxID=182337 RepID=UPI003207F0D5
MSSFGDMFPEGFESAFAANRELKVSDVLYLHCDFTTPPKNKYLVVCCCDPLLVLLINSEISEFIQARPTLLQSQVDVAQADHSFLEWDSFINCIEAHQAFNLEVVKEQIARDYRETLRGEIAEYCMREVYRAVSASQTMSRRHKASILEAMNSFQ